VERTSCACRSERELAGIRVVNFYASPLCGPGVATECLEALDGLHVHEDHFPGQIVDPERGSRSTKASRVKLVFPTLQQEAMPLLALSHRRHPITDPEPAICAETIAAHPWCLRGRRADNRLRGVNVSRRTSIWPGCCRVDRYLDGHPALPARRRRLGRDGLI